MSSRRTAWLGVAALWTLFGFVTAIQVWLSMIAHGHSVVRLVGYYVAVWLAWLGITAAIVALLRRWPVIPPRTPNLLGHTLAAGLAAVAHVAYWIALTLAVRPFDRMTADWSSYNLAGVIFARLPLELTLYATVAGAAQAVAYYTKAARLEASLNAARLHALELQLQPHFLFNTLNTVSALVRARQNDAAVDVVAGLSDLLRYTLDHAEEQQVALREECAMLRRYLEIQRARFPDRLAFTIDLAPDAERGAVPTLILQPLAENAIQHGIARRADGGVVDVRARRDGGELRIDLFNSGSLANGGEPGIGLRNTRERLRHLYGDAHRFELREVAGGVLASLALPWSERP